MDGCIIPRLIDRRPQVNSVRASNEEHIADC